MIRKLIKEKIAPKQRRGKMMRYTVLFSGSSGNCAYISIGEDTLLIDAGVSCKKIVNGLKEHDIELEQIKGILLTHEHTDHVIGLKQLVDKYGITLYLTEKTYHAISFKYRPAIRENLVFIKDTVNFGGETTAISCLPISHDVVDGKFYIIQDAEKKLVYLTDTGYVPERYYPMLQNADGYIVESNHEPELVLQSRYPWNIQHRILSDKGHLSNQDCAILLQNIVGENTTDIILAHLSEETNRPDIAYNRVKDALEQINRQTIRVSVAKRDNVDFPSIKIER